MLNSFIVLDFETTGLSPNVGARTTEVAAVLVENGRMTDRYQSLMNPGVSIPSFIQDLTGITNQMISKAPNNAKVMKELHHFIGNTPLVAHNASFDKKFLDAELDLVGLKAPQPMACSLLVARRVYQKAPNHKLGTLVKYKNIETNGVFHRALADAEMTARLWLCMKADISQLLGMKEVTYDVMRLLASTPKKDVNKQWKT
jgi:DNA polymerase-3 subunit epsilon